MGMTDPAEQRRRSESPHALWLALLVFVGVGFAVLVMQVGFLGDDFQYLATIRNLDGVRDIMDYVVQPLGASFVWRPFVNLFWLIEYNLFGTHAILYHVLHLLLYVCITWLLYRVVKRIGGAKLAMVTAVIYFMTPYHYEGFVWLSSVTDLLALSGSLAAVYLFTQFRDTGKTRTLVWCVSAYALAILSKEFALMTPLVVLLVDLLFLGDRRGPGWKPIVSVYGSLLVATAAYLAARFAVLGNLSGSDPATAGHFVDSLRPEYLKMAVNSMTFRFNVAALARVSPSFADFWSQWHGYISVLTTAVLFSLGIPRFRDRQFWKLATFAIGLIVLFALPVLPLLGNINENLQHSRFLLASSAGVALLMAVLVTNEGNIARGMRLAKRGFLLCIIAVYAAALVINAGPWVRATRVVKSAVSDVGIRFPEITASTMPTLLYVHALPGSVDGAYAFHDLYSFSEAFFIRYQNQNVTVIPVGRYRSDEDVSFCSVSADRPTHLLWWKGDHFERSDETIAGWLSEPSGATFGFDSTESFVKNGWEAHDLMVRQTDDGLEFSDFGKNPRIELTLQQAVAASNLRRLTATFAGVGVADVALRWKTASRSEYTEFQSVPSLPARSFDVPLCAYTNWAIGGDITALELSFKRVRTRTVTLSRVTFGP